MDIQIEKFRDSEWQVQDTHISVESVYVMDDDTLHEHDGRQVPTILKHMYVVTRDGRSVETFSYAHEARDLARHMVEQRVQEIEESLRSIMEEVRK